MTDKPTVPAVIVLFARTFVLVFATRPLPNAFRLAIAPVRLTVNELAAPPSDVVKPDPTAK